MNKHQKKGFGLLEVLLAGVIIIIMLSALVVVARSALQNSIYLQQRSQATFLAQEGMEIVRQIRDTNYIDGNNATKWNTMKISAMNPKAVCAGKNTCYPKYIGASINRLLLSDDQTAAGSTNEDRIVMGGIEYITTITFSSSMGNILDPVSLGEIDPNLDDANAYKVTVTVSWGDNKSVQVEEILANSRQGY